MIIKSALLYTPFLRNNTKYREKKQLGIISIKMYGNKSYDFPIKTFGAFKI